MLAWWLLVLVVLLAFVVVVFEVFACPGICLYVASHLFPSGLMCKSRVAFPLRLRFFSSQASCAARVWKPDWLGPLRPNRNINILISKGHHTGGHLRIHVNTNSAQHMRVNRAGVIHGIENDVHEPFAIQFNVDAMRSAAQSMLLCSRVLPSNCDVRLQS